MIEIVEDIKTFPTQLIWGLYDKNWLTYANMRVSLYSIYRVELNLGPTSITYKIYNFIGIDLKLET